MKYIISSLILVIGIISCAQLKNKKEDKTEEVMSDSKQIVKDQNDNIKLGAFSMSLAVKDLAISKAFYENLGFKVKGGAMEKNYLVMKNGNSLIGLFQGMFEDNILTFNPGWDEDGENIEIFDDVRLIQKHLQSKGVNLDAEADATTTGPAHIMLKDPDGNVILIDQHR